MSIIWDGYASDIPQYLSRMQRRFRIKKLFWLCLRFAWHVTLSIAIVLLCVAILLALMVEFETWLLGGIINR